MTDPQLPSIHAGEPIRWEPWKTTAECGRQPLPRACAYCHRETVHDHAKGRAGTVLTVALRCGHCGTVEARWRDEQSGKLIVAVTGIGARDGARHWNTGEQPILAVDSTDTEPSGPSS